MACRVGVPAHRFHAGNKRVGDSTHPPINVRLNRSQLQHRRQQLRQWMIIAIAIAIPLCVGARALMRLSDNVDLLAGVGEGLLALLCALVLFLLAMVFLIAWMCSPDKRSWRD